MPTTRKVSASRKPTATRQELAILAGRSGLVANNEEGRQAFAAWLATDNEAARAALFGRVAANRVAASRTTAPKGSAKPKKYPAGWLRAAGAQAGAAKAVAAQDYPAGWLRAAGVRTGGHRSCVTQACD